MGKKTKFINKETSQKYHLLHRSQLDSAYAGDTVPSEFVLVAADESANDNKKSRKEASNVKLDSDFFASNMKPNHDHINALGFVNDGYDYSQHLKEMGGGKFIGKDGKAQAVDFSYNKEKEVAFMLPEDALPSGQDLDRDLQAITISHDLMDEDIRAALFDGEDEEGEFEELNDDFITEAMMEPMTSDFDYDAHIAALIAKSQEKLGVVTARGWEGAENKALRGRRVRHTDEGSEDDEEDEDEDEDEEYEEFSDGDFVDVVTEEERQKIELQFERTLGEYDDEEIGELEDDEEQLEGGIIELDGDNVLFNNMIDEFLQDKKDEIWAEGTLVQKGTRSTILVKKGQDAKTVITTTIEEIQSAPVDIQKEISEQTALQTESQLYLRDLDQFGEGYVEIETCQAYLAEEREVEKWDCESILSTYSTLDNHPSLIKDGNEKFRRYKSRHEKSLDKEAKNTSDTASIGTREAVPRQTTSTAPGHIVLSGKLNLPDGFGPHKTGDSKKMVRKEALKAAHTATGSAVHHTLGGKKMSLIPEVEEEEYSEESGDDNDEQEGESDSDGSFYEKHKKATPVGGRPREETAEEKRLRKLAVKESRKVKRTSKKDLKLAYKAEGNRLTNVAGREQSTDHVSVFKYSN